MPRPQENEGPVGSWNKLLELGVLELSFMLFLWHRLEYWSPDVKGQLTGKDPDAGKDWGPEENGWREMRGLDSITGSMDMSSRRQWRTGRPVVLQYVGLQRVRHDIVTATTEWETRGSFQAVSSIFHLSWVLLSWARLLFDLWPLGTGYPWSYRTKPPLPDSSSCCFLFLTFVWWWR